MLNRSIAILLMAFLYDPVEIAFADESDEQKAVLITGASTGIGRNIAETLAAKGHFVYAGARKQTDLDALNAIANIQGIRLDVTVQKEIDAAVETITNEGRGLYGLVSSEYHASRFAPRRNGSKRLTKAGTSWRGQILTSL